MPFEAVVGAAGSLRCNSPSGPACRPASGESVWPPAVPAPAALPASALAARALTRALPDRVLPEPSSVMRGSLQTLRSVRCEGPPLRYRFMSSSLLFRIPRSWIALEGAVGFLGFRLALILEDPVHVLLPIQRHADLPGPVNTLGSSIVTSYWMVSASSIV